MLRWVLFWLLFLSIPPLSCGIALMFLKTPKNRAKQSGEVIASKSSWSKVDWSRVETYL